MGGRGRGRGKAKGGGGGGLGNGAWGNSRGDRGAVAVGGGFWDMPGSHQEKGKKIGAPGRGRGKEKPKEPNPEEEMK